MDQGLEHLGQLRRYLERDEFVLLIFRSLGSGPTFIHDWGLVGSDPLIIQELRS